MTAIDYPERVVQLQKRLKNKRVSALLVTNPANRRYLSGYTAEDHSIRESSGVLLVPANGLPVLVTDSRFLLQAQEEAPDCDVQLYNKGLAASLKRLLPKMGIRKLGFESEYFLVATYNRFEKMAQTLNVELVALDGLIERQRVVKTEDEIAKITASVLLNEKVFQNIYDRIQPGMSEREIALAIERDMMERGADAPSFETIVAFGTNGAKPHAVPSAERILEPGETVLIDMGLILDGYCSDMTRTFVAGKPDETFVERQRIVRKAQKEAIKVIRAGMTCREVDRAARKVIQEAGYGKYFGHALGHGVGVEVHEEPRLSSASRRKLQPGMIVTVEPGIYLPDWGGVRLEDMIVVREDGCDVLNTDKTFLDI